MKVILFSLMVFNLGCASYQAGNYAEVVSGEHPEKAPISGLKDETLSTRNYVMVNFTFGNESDEWLRVKKVRLNFDDQEMNKNINIVVGEDIFTWAESIQHKVEVDQWNRDILLGSFAFVAVAASAAGSGSNSPELQVAGLGLYGASAGIIAANGIIDKVNELERAKLFPRTHLYSSFSVPAGLHSQRWILLQVKDAIVPDHVNFDIEYLDGKRANYRIKI